MIVCVLRFIFLSQKYKVKHLFVSQNYFKIYLKKSIWNSKLSKRTDFHTLNFKYQEEMYIFFMVRYTALNKINIMLLNSNYNTCYKYFIVISFIGA